MCYLFQQAMHCIQTPLCDWQLTSAVCTWEMLKKVVFRAFFFGKKKDQCLMHNGLKTCSIWPSSACSVFRYCEVLLPPVAIRIAATCIYQYNPFVHPCSYYYLLSPSILFFAHLICFALFYSIAHFTLYFSFLLIFIYMLLCCVTLIYFLHCPLSGPDLICISLLIIPCII